MRAAVTWPTGEEQMKRWQPCLLAGLCLAILMAFAACQQTQTRPRTEWTAPLPDLDKIEECQRADLNRYFGSSFRFHLYDCWANVSIDTMGRVIAFQPDDAEACEKVLATKC
jgi:hypothetical protein